ncbi:MerC family mercury resistance protein [Sphingomonas changnyeongensis]|uniref:MerC family mercury resistance protein n=2 Tax=Sphingomonas changnyeongensis TaxID=2698679 RepID=A0A7Z2NYY0_9SPHN|nr:MerC family mercury resistance protein [Sphingomonas changnyeongensis]
MPARLLDGAAIAASALCLVHCLALPLVALMLPMLAAWVAWPEAFHLWAFAFAVPTSLVALALGVRGHRRAAPLLAGGAGLALLAAGVAADVPEPAETLLTVAGALALARAHLVNWRSRAHGCAAGPVARTGSGQAKGSSSDGGGSEK